MGQSISTSAAAAALDDKNDPGYDLEFEEDTQIRRIFTKYEELDKKLTERLAKIKNKKANGGKK